MCRTPASLAAQRPRIPALLEWVCTIAGLTRQPAVFRYMIDAIVEAEEDEEDQVVMSPEEKGSVILLLKTAIDTLDEARERAR